MFERYTENARRAIFFARYESSQFGSGSIEPEHLLLALLRETTGLAYRLLRSSPAAAEGIRSDIEAHFTPVEKTSSSVDLPLGPECKRILAFASEEAEKLISEHIDSEHLLLGILREETSFAAGLLREHGFTLDLVREKAQKSGHSVPQGGSAWVATLEKWLAGREASASAWTMERQHVGKGATLFALYANENQVSQDDKPASIFETIWKRIDAINKRMNRAIANHEFEEARSLSEEARNQLTVLRQLQKQFGFEESSRPIPFLCIEVIANDRLSEIQERSDGYIAQGVAAVWLLNPASKRAYTVTKAEGLRECKDGVLRTAGALLEMDLKEIFE